MDGGAGAALRRALGTLAGRRVRCPAGRHLEIRNPKMSTKSGRFWQAVLIYFLASPGAVKVDSVP